MKSLFYQILHPWHWLTYGQSATGLAALAALMGLVGLYFYTRYTRRMMELGEITNRATVTPILVSSGSVQLEPVVIQHTPASELGFLDPTVTAVRAVVTVRNVGEGAAIYLGSWAQIVSATSQIDNSILTRTGHVTSGEHTTHELLKGESTEVRFAPFKPSDIGGRLLFVIECSDPVNGFHQLQMPYSGLPNGEAHVAMVHRKEKQPKTVL
jgi:hypothetical protein